MTTTLRVLFLTFFCAIFTLSCQNSTENEKSQLSKEEKREARKLERKLARKNAEPRKHYDESTECYRFLNAEDTVFLTLNTIDDKLNGRLIYAMEGEERRSGLFRGKETRGKIEGFLIRMDGLEREKEEFYFTRINDGLFPGLGEKFESEGQIKYKETSKINYPRNKKIYRIPCRFLNNNCYSDLGLAYSELRDTCISLIDEGLSIYKPISNVEGEKRLPARVIVDEEIKEAEVFWYHADRGIVLTQVANGKYSDGTHTLNVGDENNISINGEARFELVRSNANRDNE